MDTLSIGLTIRSLRDAKGISGKELAKQANIRDYELSRLERGHQKLDLERAIRLARALGVSMNEFCDAVLRVEPQVQQQKEAFEIALHAHKRLTALVGRLDALGEKPSSTPAA
jgi:transcriptional regulator with XRE-family HTH domain